MKVCEVSENQVSSRYPQPALVCVADERAGKGRSFRRHFLCILMVFIVLDEEKRKHRRLPLERGRLLGKEEERGEGGGVKTHEKGRRGLREERKGRKEVETKSELPSSRSRVLNGRDARSGTF